MPKMRSQKEPASPQGWTPECEIAERTCPRCGGSFGNLPNHLEVCDGA